jgi:hypothetical protein
MMLMDDRERETERWKAASSTVMMAKSEELPVLLNRA